MINQPEMETILMTDRPAMADYPYERPPCYGSPSLWQTDLLWQTTLMRDRPAMGDQPYKEADLLWETTLMENQPEMETIHKINFSIQTNLLWKTTRLQGPLFPCFRGGLA